MITPNENEFTEHDPLSIASSPIGDRSLREETRSINAGSSGDKWEQTKAKAVHARERTEFFLRENPIPTIVAALGVGLIIGWALRHSISSEEEEVEVKSPLGNMSWSFLSLPFLLPFFKSLKERCEDSAETVKDGMGRLKKMDITPYTKPIRKRWKAWTG
ncbi:MAG: hypothetical protein QOG67_2807 [Verrucomicrobiota bacterium]|jgi:hypothetical protein